MGICFNVLSLVICVFFVGFLFVLTGETLTQHSCACQDDHSDISRFGELVKTLTLYVQKVPQPSKPLGQRPGRRP